MRQGYLPGGLSSVASLSGFRVEVALFEDGVGSSGRPLIGIGGLRASLGVKEVRDSREDAVVPWARCQEGSHRLQSGSWSVQLADGDGGPELRGGTGCDGQQHSVELVDLSPVC